MKLAGKMTAKIAGAFLVVAAIAAAQTVVSVRDGVYTAAQGDRGKALYAANCASCHGAMLDGSGAAPPLAGADFIGNWKGQTAGDLHEKIQSTMPADQPGKLSREQNSDILAFLLASNNFPAGEKELPSEAAALGKIRIEADKAK
jgi:mono/diheme cytochrome c family protein